MRATEHATTTVSTKGQIVLPSAVRARRGWGAGQKLIVEETPQGVLLRPVPVFKPTRPEDVFGCLKYDGPPLSIEDMKAGVREKAAERYAGD